VTEARRARVGRVEWCDQDGAAVRVDRPTRALRLEQGELCDDDHHANQMSLTDGSRILSVFRLKTGEKVRVLTEAVGGDGKRASTCLLLPDEY
jgi:hypothetical protein